MLPQVRWTCRSTEAAALELLEEQTRLALEGDPEAPCQLPAYVDHWLGRRAVERRSKP